MFGLTELEARYKWEEDVGHCRSHNNFVDANQCHVTGGDEIVSPQRSLFTNLTNIVSGPATVFYEECSSDLA